jgi:hypothetical protein
MCLFIQTQIKLNSSQTQTHSWCRIGDSGEKCNDQCIKYHESIMLSYKNSDSEFMPYAFKVLQSSIVSPWVLFHLIVALLTSCTAESLNYDFLGLSCSEIIHKMSWLKMLNSRTMSFPLMLLPPIRILNIWGTSTTMRTRFKQWYQSCCLGPMFVSMHVS